MFENPRDAWEGYADQRPPMPADPGRLRGPEDLLALLASIGGCPPAEIPPWAWLDSARIKALVAWAAGDPAWRRAIVRRMGDSDFASLPRRPRREPPDRWFYAQAWRRIIETRDPGVFMRDRWWAGTLEGGSLGAPAGAALPLGIGLPGSWPGQRASVAMTEIPAAPFVDPRTGRLRDAATGHLVGLESRPVQPHPHAGAPYPAWVKLDPSYDGRPPRGFADDTPIETSRDGVTRILVADEAQAKAAMWPARSSGA